MSSSTTETQAPAGTLSVLMPQMGISVSEGTILEWRKSLGDPVEADETICDVTTDKVDVEIPSPASGVLARILAEPGETLAVGEPIAEIGTDAAPSEVAGPRTSAGPAEDERQPDESDRSGFYSPVVRRIAAEHEVDLSRVEGHGVGGRVRKKDLLAHLESGASGNGEAPTAEASAGRPLHTESPYVPDPPGAHVSECQTNGEAGRAALSPANPSPNVATNGDGAREPMSAMRRSIGEHMVRSIQTSAHCTTIVEVDFSAVARRRAELKEAFSRKGVPLTYLAFVAKAVIEALEEHPVLNASIDGDDLVMHDDVNLGIAVSLEPDGEREGGLIVPVIHRAQRLSLEGLAAAIGELAAKARERRLDPDDVRGGTFTITNPGQFGAVLATPIINQPQVAILDLEAIVKRTVVVEGPDGSDAIAIRPMGFLPMSWDHRALDGAEAAKFLGSVKRRLEGGEI